MLTEQENRIIAGAILDIALSAGDLDTAASIFKDFGEREALEDWSFSRCQETPILALRNKKLLMRS